ncbi:unnamed protein product [Heligmosomoides polygyrus]|uniref:Uncharacterized protein n=1 Tax=Heligmosomoides polygyrus TaxID=6339 RepID=A0A183G922_HELPZ|nr:unnamed protein product [Heligmosomoides polygyrus]
MCSCSGAVTDRANLINDGANQNGCLSDVKLTASALSDHLPKSIERMLEKLVAANVGADSDRGNIDTDTSSRRSATGTVDTQPTPRVVVIERGEDALRRETPPIS